MGHGDLWGAHCSRVESEAVGCAADPDGSFSLSVGLFYVCLADGFRKSPPGLVQEPLLGLLAVVTSRLCLLSHLQWVQVQESCAVGLLSPSVLGNQASV